MASKAAQNYVRGLMYQGSRDGSITYFISPAQQMRMMYDFDQRNGTGAQTQSSGVQSGYGSDMTIEQLIAMQRGENARTAGLTEANWQEGKKNLYGVMPGFDADPMTSGARGLAQGLMNNPEAINDQTQAMIRNRLMNTLGAQAGQARTSGMNSLSSRGMMNPAALARMNERLGSQENATLSRAMADTEIERAMRKNQDIMQASGLGRQLGMDRAGLNMDVNKTYLENMPQYMPEDLSGMAALINTRNMGNKGPVGTSKQYGTQFNSTPGFQLTNFNAQGQQSPGQTGFAPGLRGDYSWTGQLSGGGGGVQDNRYQQGRDEMDAFVANLGFR